MNRKYKDRMLTSMPFERDNYHRLKSLLPREITVADEINEMVKQRVNELEKDKSLSTSDKSPVRIHENNGFDNKTIIDEKQQASLDIYCSKVEMKNHVDRINHESEAWMLKRQAQLLMNLAQTRAKKLQGILTV